MYRTLLSSSRLLSIATSPFFRGRSICRKFVVNENICYKKTVTGTEKKIVISGISLQDCYKQVSQYFEEKKLFLKKICFGLGFSKISLLWPENSFKMFVLIGYRLSLIHGTVGPTYPHSWRCFFFILQTTFISKTVFRYIYL